MSDFKRYKKKEEKCKPGINFRVNIPLNFSISSPVSLQKEFKDKLGENRGVSKKLREWFFGFFEVGNETELLKVNKIIRKKVQELKDEIKDEMGMDSKEFSEHFREKMTAFIGDKK